MELIRLLIADDHRVYREGIPVLLRDVHDVSVVGEAADGEETILQAERLQPDVIVIAARLGLSIKTVQNHIPNIFSKLQVVDRAQAIVRAREAGLGSALQE